MTQAQPFQMQPSQPHTGLRPWQQIAAFCIAYLALFARRPDALLHAQFWAEDGHVWFADAWNIGWWKSLILVHTGYFQTLPRLGVSLALLVPLTEAPLLLNLISIAVLAFPVCLLLSSRAGVWGNLGTRAILAALYLALPNCEELSFGVTQLQWLLALSAFLILTFAAPRNRWDKSLDLFILVLCGLSGPFLIPLTPIAIVLAWSYRDRWRWIRAGALATLCCVQAWALLVIDPAGRANGGVGTFAPHTPLGATPELFARILGGQVYLGTLLGGNGLAAIPRFTLLLALVAICGTALFTILFLKSRLEMRLLILLAAGLFAVSLKSPIGFVPSGATAWQWLSGAPSIRYWFYPTLAFAWALAFCWRTQSGALRKVAAALLLLMSVGIVRDWHRQSFPDLHLPEYAQRLAAAPPGTTVVFPLNPSGWEMNLVKHNNP